MALEFRNGKIRAAAPMYEGPNACNMRENEELKEYVVQLLSESQHMLEKDKDKDMVSVSSFQDLVTRVEKIEHKLLEKQPTNPGGTIAESEPLKKYCRIYGMKMDPRT